MQIRRMMMIVKRILNIRTELQLHPVYYFVWELLVTDLGLDLHPTEWCNTCEVANKLTQSVFRYADTWKLKLSDLVGRSMLGERFGLYQSSKRSRIPQ